MALMGKTAAGPLTLPDHGAFTNVTIENVTRMSAFAVYLVKATNTWVGRDGPNIFFALLDRDSQQRFAQRLFWLALTLTSRADSELAKEREARNRAHSSGLSRMTSTRYPTR